jgi:hypothetical protein
MGARERETERNKRYNLKLNNQFEVLTVVTTKSTIFREVMPCSPVEIHHQFRVMYCLHFEVEGQAKQAAVCLNKVQSLEYHTPSVLGQQSCKFWGSTYTKSYFRFRSS